MSSAKQIDDGGPAFPISGPFLGVTQGMSLRDWFAGQALAGILSGRQHALDSGMAADVAFRFADAMLAVRKSTT